MSVQADSGSSAVLKIQINIKGQQDREVVKKCTYKGFEVVEINGAVFYRKRKSCAADAADAAPEPCKRQQGEAHEHADPPAADATEQHVEAAAAAGAEDEAAAPADAEQHVEGAGPCMGMAEAACTADEVPHQAVQEDLNPEDLKTQLDNCLPASCPKALAVQFSLEKLLMHGARALDNSHATAEYSNAARRVLSSFSGALQQQAELAGALLLQASRCSVSAAQSSGSGDGPAPQAAGAGHDVPEAPPLERYVRLAPMIRELSHGSLLQARLQQQLHALQQEEQAWTSLRQKYREPCAAAAGAVAAAQPPLAAGPEAPAPAQEGGVTLLKQTEESVNAALALQVEALGAFLSKVDAMVAKGEEACMTLQAHYHEHKFRTFPHVNSPAWLIRQIISKQQSLTTMEAGAEQQ